MRVLVTAASKYGATREIAEAIGRALVEHGVDVHVVLPAEVRSVHEYDAVVLGSAVYAGQWLEPATALVEREAQALATRPVWLFSSGPVGDPKRKLVKKMGADPLGLPQTRGATQARDHRMFAGKLDLKQLSRPQRAACKVMRLGGGDYRDWDAIRAWAVEIAQALGSTARLPKAS